MPIRAATRRSEIRMAFSTLAPSRFCGALTIFFGAVPSSRRSQHRAAPGVAASVHSPSPTASVGARQAPCCRRISAATGRSIAQSRRSPWPVGRSTSRPSPPLAATPRSARLSACSVSFRVLLSQDEPEPFNWISNLGEDQADLSLNKYILQYVLSIKPQGCGAVFAGGLGPSGF